MMNLTRKTKTSKKEKWLNTRVSVEMHAAFKQYSQDSGIKIGDLIRRALQEYIWRHPLPERQEKK